MPIRKPKNKRVTSQVTNKSIILMMFGKTGNNIKQDASDTYTGHIIGANQKIMFFPQHHTTIGSFQLPFCL